MIPTLQQFTDNPGSVKMQDIADRAGVGRTTVSLALRDHPKISPKTRQRIRELAEAMGYHPNPLVAAHMAYIRELHPKPTGQTLAFVWYRSLAEARADRNTPVYKYYLGAKARAEALGFGLEFFNLHERNGQLADILKVRGISGVIIAPMSEGGVMKEVAFEWNSFACVAIGHSLPSPRLHTVCNDEYATMREMFAQLGRLSYRRIGIAMCDAWSADVGHIWLAGYLLNKALTTPANRVPPFVSKDWDRARFLRWFKRCRPEAIITINDDIVGWLREDGWAVPGDVACATVYWKEIRAHLGGYYQNHELMGAEAVNIVATQLYHNERGIPVHPRKILVESEWKEGETIMPRLPAGRRDCPDVPKPATGAAERGL